MQQKKVIIDCDPGCDDALALLLALANREINIKGITVSAGNVHINNTTENARKIMGYFDNTIPVAKGCEKPMFRTMVTAAEVHGESGIGQAKLKEVSKEIEDINAVEFIAKTLRESEDKITIVITGPMTNIAVFLMMYPELREKIEKFLIMGGSAVGGNVTPCAEFNIYVDAEAADIVFKSGVDIVLCPLDVTLKAFVTEDELQDIKNIGGYASEIAYGAIKNSLEFHRSVNKSEAVPMHDPCTIAYLLNEDMFKGQRAFVGVELKGSFTYGETVIDYKNKLGNEPNALVLNGIDRDIFISMLKGAITELKK